MDKAQREFLTRRTKGLLGRSPEMKPLLDKLLSLGGEFAVLPVLEEDLHRILSRGFKQYGWNAQLHPGEVSRCHANAAGLWDANRGRLQIVTGYALSEDGIWRQHSWCRDLQQSVRNRGLKAGYRIVETTKKRKLYFGYVLTEEEAQKFADNNF